jgi:hypothetical protein
VVNTAEAYRARSAWKIQTVDLSGLC